MTDATSNEFSDQLEFEHSKFRDAIPKIVACFSITMILTVLYLASVASRGYSNALLIKRFNNDLKAYKSFDRITQKREYAYILDYSDLTLQKYLELVRLVENGDLEEALVRLNTKGFPKPPGTENLEKGLALAIKQREDAAKNLEEPLRADEIRELMEGLRFESRKPLTPYVRPLLAERDLQVYALVTDLLKSLNLADLPKV